MFNKSTFKLSLKFCYVTAFSSLIFSSCVTQGVQKKSFSDSEVCKPTYNQVYQPAIKIGGSGRLINVKSGEACKIVKTSNDDVKSTQSLSGRRFSTQDMRKVRIESLQSDVKFEILNARTGEIVTRCGNPCVTELDGLQRYPAYSSRPKFDAYAIQKGEPKTQIPFELPYRVHQGVSVKVDSTNMSKTVFNIWPKPDLINTRRVEAESFDGLRIRKLQSENHPVGEHRSGECSVMVDILPNGATTNIRLISCSVETYNNAALTSALNSAYFPLRYSSEKVMVTNKIITFYFGGN